MSLIMILKSESIQQQRKQSEPKFVSFFSEQVPMSYKVAYSWDKQYSTSLESASVVLLCARGWKLARAYSQIDEIRRSNPNSFYSLWTTTRSPSVCRQAQLTSLKIVPTWSFQVCTSRSEKIALSENSINASIYSRTRLLSGRENVLEHAHATTWIA